MERRKTIRCLGLPAPRLLYVCPSQVPFKPESKIHVGGDYSSQRGQWLEGQEAFDLARAKGKTLGATDEIDPRLLSQKPNSGRVLCAAFGKMK